MDIGTVFAAVTGSVVTRLICFPIDTITVHRQTLTKEQRRARGRLPLTAYYRGLPISILFVTPGTVAYLSAYRWSKEFSKPITGAGTLLNYGCAALISEFSSSFIWTPMEVMKARVQIASTGGARAKITRLWHEEGIRGFYRGYWMGLAVYMPYAAGWWLVYERLKNWMANKSSSNQNSVLATVLGPFAASGVATLIAGGLSAPLELVKTRYQVANSPEIRGNQAVDSSISVPKVVRSLYREEGWTGFTRGIGYRMCYMVPGAMISMAVFEYLKPDIEWDAEE